MTDNVYFSIQIWDSVSGLYIRFMSTLSRNCRIMKGRPTLYLFLPVEWQLFPTIDNLEWYAIIIKFNLYFRFYDYKCKSWTLVCVFMVISTVWCIAYFFVCDRRLLCIGRILWVTEILWSNFFIEKFLFSNRILLLVFNALKTRPLLIKMNIIMFLLLPFCHINLKSNRT